MSDSTHGETAGTPPIEPPPGDTPGDPARLRYTREVQDTELTRGQRVSLIVVAGLILSAVVGGVIAKAITHDGYPGEPIITAHLQIGDCVARTVDAQGATTMPEVPCDEPHQSEVVGTFAPSGPYPGVLVDPEGWRERCADLLRSYAPAAAAHIGTSYVLPTEEQWDDPAYRVVCFATDLKMRTGSIKSWQGTEAPSPGVAA
ncbi:hypothetical protein CS0771_43600 [Catellatospora sp. IY07-71]|uniref:septum formation family protein n=1 Tax=Catellatospora sp. IY07-71 TaxID=2728827 RepID=UPI001BB45ABF|nr:septum formation family protein [Catellatospora sp. IY07-71]BCJ74816.1 hypothetical protein CS0771_43600 [Catellatospora sp. IY07-71]